MRSVPKINSGTRAAEWGEVKMVFEPLHESNLRVEFFGGMCHFHLCKVGKKAGQVTIREIIVERDSQGNGMGQLFINRLKAIPGAKSLFANCPADLPSNGFYEVMGFKLESQIPTKNGRAMNQWRLTLAQS